MKNVRIVIRLHASLPMDQYSLNFDVLLPSDSTVDIATGYDLDDRVVGFRIPVG
jgi:hypothetical protein